MRGRREEGERQERGRKEEEKRNERGKKEKGKRKEREAKERKERKEMIENLHGSLLQHFRPSIVAEPCPHLPPPSQCPYDENEFSVWSLAHASWFETTFKMI
jgi:hypothetical protein